MSLCLCVELALPGMLVPAAFTQECVRTSYIRRIENTKTNSEKDSIIPTATKHLPKREGCFAVACIPVAHTFPWYIDENIRPKPAKMPRTIPVAGDRVPALIAFFIKIIKRNP